MAMREDSYHALIQCPHADALWLAMREIWPITKVLDVHGREDWLESWLESMPLEMCSRSLMIAWRAWYARNEVTHDKPLPSVEGSRRFIRSYMQSLDNICRATPEKIMKGKQIIGDWRSDVHETRRRPATQEGWSSPPSGVLKLNVDGAFVAQTGLAGAGMILWRSNGSIIFSACRDLDSVRRRLMRSCRHAWRGSS